MRQFATQPYPSRTSYRQGDKLREEDPPSGQNLSAYRLGHAPVMVQLLRDAISELLIKGALKL